jgi:HD-GYP domain-containing protein (c-di-GMP phosphodiesterase class II)
MTPPASYPQALGPVEALTIALDVRDIYTRAHCDRVLRLAMELGDACRLSEAQLDRLAIAARFHDVGKIGVPDAVLMKPTQLTPGEWSMMKEHSVHGERIFRAAQVPGHDEIADAIRHHHESFDGSGYPDGMRAEEIPLICRVLLIVDAYDAMGTPRPYHRGRGHEEIMEVLESESGRKLDPEVLREFSKMIVNSPARVH